MSTIAAAGDRLMIRASAGTGKTFQLSNRYLRLLHADATGDEILASTFTRKAAGEILERVLQRLARAASNQHDAAELAAHIAAPNFDQPRALELLTQFTRRLHRTHICTLDALFLNVAMSMSLELGLMPGWSIIDDPDDPPLRDRAIDAVLDSGQSADLTNLTRLLSKGEYKQSVAAAIRSAVDDVHRVFLDTDAAAWDWFPRIRRMSDADFLAALDDFAEIPTGSARQADAHQESVADAQREDWNVFLRKGLARAILIGDGRYYGKEVPPETVAGYELIFVRARAFFFDAVAGHTRATRQLAERFDERYGELKRQAGGLLFDDVPRLIARGLNTVDRKRVAYRMDSNIRHVLLDEFQDTSLVQWQAIRELVLGESGDRLKSFFCVGDGKQAIYGWRGGLAEIFEAVPEQIPEVVEAPLNRSYRSWPPIVETVNTVFKTLPTLDGLDELEDAIHLWCGRFGEHQTVFSTEPEASERGYAQLLVGPEPEDSETADQTMHRFAAEKIADLANQMPGRTIGVLTRRNVVAGRIAFELRKRGIAASEEGGSHVDDSGAVLAVLSLLQLAEHPGDSAARYHIANSPLGPITGLHDFRSELNSVQCAAAIRRDLAERGFGTVLCELTEKLLPECSMRDVVRLRQIIELGWKFDAKPSQRIRDFMQLVDACKLEAPTDDPVRVMTLHKAKGLEFDIVVLPELNQSLRTPRVAWSSPDHTEPPDRVSMYLKREAQALMPPKFREVFEQTTNREAIEALCLLYVGLTRAVHALHMFVPPGKAFSRGRNEKPFTSFAGILRASLNFTCTPTPGTVLYERGNPGWHTRDLQHRRERDTPAPAATAEVVLPADGLNLAPMRGPRRRGLRRTAPSVHRKRPAGIEHLLSSANIVGRARGSVFHRWFEMIEWLDDPLPPDDEFRNVLSDPALSKLDLDDLLRDFFACLDAPAVRSALTRHGVLSAESPFDTQTRQRLESEVFRLVVRRERAFAVQQADEIVSGTIDRLVLVVDENNQAVAADIIDFKTDEAESKRDLKRLRATYADQLGAYSTAVSQIYGLPADRITSRLLLTSNGTVLD